MKILITILVLCFSVSAIAQEVVWQKVEPEKKVYKFPEGFNPDGRLLRPVITFFYLRSEENLLNLKADNFFGKIDLPVDPVATFFFYSEYRLFNSENPLINIRDKSFSWGVGVRLFSGM